MEKDEGFQQELWNEIEEEAEGILEKAHKEGERLLEDARHRSEEQWTDFREKLESDLETRRRRALSRAKLEGHNTLRRLRREEVGRVIEDARKMLLEMRRNEPDRYAEILWEFFRAGRDVLPAGSLRVRIGEAGKRIGDRLKREKDVEVVVEKDLDGLILESGQRNLRCDFSLETLLERLRSEREAEIAEVLFGERDEPQDG